MTVAKIVVSGLALVLTFTGLVAIGKRSEHTDARYDVEHKQGQFAPSHALPNYEPYSHYLADKGPPVVKGQSRFTEWKVGIRNWRPSFRKGGKSGVGLKTAF